jgi:hypothetical protein
VRSANLAKDMLQKMDTETNIKGFITYTPVEGVVIEEVKNDEEVEKVEEAPIVLEGDENMILKKDEAVF